MLDAPWLDFSHRRKAMRELDGHTRLCADLVRQLLPKLQCIGSIADRCLPQAASALRAELQQIQQTCREARALLEARSPLSEHGDSETRLGDTTKWLQAQLYALATALDVELDFSVKGALAPLVTDDLALACALRELICNAVDAGASTVMIAAQQVELDSKTLAPECVPGSYLQVEIHDEGRGLTRGVGRNGVEPLAAIKGRPRRSLSMAHGLAKRYGGALRMVSHARNGTTAVIQLPSEPLGSNDAAAVSDTSAPAELAEQQSSLTYHDAHSSETPPGAPSRPLFRDRTVGTVDGATAAHVAAADLPRGTETILVVDDEPLPRSAARRVLASLGYRVLEAESGDEALQILSLEHNDVDLLISDVNLPEVSGFEVAERLQQRCPALRTLFMSGYPADTIEGAPAGARFVDKPFTHTDLATMVRALLDGNK